MPTSTRQPAKDLNSLRCSSQQGGRQLTQSWQPGLPGSTTQDKQRQLTHSWQPGLLEALPSPLHCQLPRWHDLILVCNLSSHFDFPPPHLYHSSHLSYPQPINLSPLPSNCFPHSRSPSSLSYFHSLAPITNSSSPTPDCPYHSLTSLPLPCVFLPNPNNDHNQDNYTECVNNDHQPCPVKVSLEFPVTSH